MDRRSSLAALLALALAGCATPQPEVYKGVSFLPTAPYISSAFLTPSGDVYMVPERGVLVQQVTMPHGQAIEWRVDGSYMVLPAASIHAVQWVYLLIDGKRRKQPLRSFIQP